MVANSYHSNYMGSINRGIAVQTRPGIKGDLISKRKKGGTFS
jgi:hypothetical protein